MGLFGAVSFDEGETWPVKRLITDGQPDHQVERMDGRLFTMPNQRRAERIHVGLPIALIHCSLTFSCT